jgi:hypothetical protein
VGDGIVGECVVLGQRGKIGSGADDDAICRVALLHRKGASGDALEVGGKILRGIARFLGG